MNFRFQWVIVLVIGLIALGCSGSSSPLIPGDDLKNPSLTGSGIQKTGQTSKALWGTYDILIEPETGKVEVLPLRGVQYTVDVVKFLQYPAGKPTNLQVYVYDASKWLSEGILGVDVGLTHPFPGFMQFTGFDVMGVLVSPGTISGIYDNDVKYTDGVNGVKLLNADGYTRWMNPSEFPDTGIIFDFTPGALGYQQIDYFTATINGYKYYADGLVADQDVGAFFASDPVNIEHRGYFRPGSNNHRQFLIKFPMPGGTPQVRFQYAVVASWVQPDKTLSGEPDQLEVPGDFPESANADEAIFMKLTNKSNMYYYQGSGGGNLKVDLEVFDWDAYNLGMKVSDAIYQIVVEADPNVLPGGYATFDSATLNSIGSPGTTAISSVYQIEVAGMTPQSANKLPILITIESMDPDSFDPGNGIEYNDDRLASYFLAEIPVGNTPPGQLTVVDPNGGETLYMTLDYEIKWESFNPAITTVAIEYSIDDFASDINLIDTTDNDGSYLWEYIPKVHTETAKIRVRDISGSEEDISDDYFKIYPPVWLDIKPSTIVTLDSIAWDMFSGTVSYEQSWDELSPAITQDHDGLAHVCWHTELAIPDDPLPDGHRLAREVGIRTMDGDSWNGVGGFFFTWGGTAKPEHELRGDFLKLAAASNNTTFAQVWHWTIYFSVDVDHFYNNHNYYNAYTLFSRIYKNGEIMADDQYLYHVSDGATGIGDGPGIYSYRYVTPNNSWAGWPDSSDPIPSMNTLTSSGEISHSRSWAMQDNALVLAFYTTNGYIKLLRQTDTVNDVWNDSDVIFGGAGYDNAAHPALTGDNKNRLFVVWTGKEQSSGKYHLMMSRLDNAGGMWTQPMVIAVSETENFDDQHITAHNTQYQLPNGAMEDLLLIGYEVDNQVFYQIVMVDKWDWLPAYPVSPSNEISRDPDTLCMDAPYGYDSLFAWSYQITEGALGYGNWDIKFANANFVTPQ